MLGFFVSDLYNLWKGRAHVPGEDKDGRLKKGISDSISMVTAKKILL